MSTSTQGGSFNTGVEQVVSKPISSRSPSHGWGYAAGAGGIVTQLSSKSTAVTLNKITGQITMNNASLTGGAEVSFTVNNTVVRSTDVVVVNWSSVGTASTYAVQANTIANGSFVITVSNWGSTLGEAIVLTFLILRATTT